MAQIVEKARTTCVSTHEIRSHNTLVSDVEETSPTTQERTVDATAEARAVLKRAYRKVDLRFLACYAALDLFTRIGEHNIANAAIM